MRFHVANPLPRDVLKLREIGKNLQEFWSVGNFEQAEIVCERQYTFIREIEERLPSNIRYHKGDILYNWGISLNGQANIESEFLGVTKFILAYIEDLYDHDSFVYADKLPAARVLRNNYPEIDEYRSEIRRKIESAIQNNVIPKNPIEIIRWIDNESFEKLRSLFRFRPIDKATEGEKAKSKVFIIHGRNLKAKKAMCEFLRSIGLEIIKWMDMIIATENPNPYLYEIVKKGFDFAQAVVVLMTPDDDAMLRKELWEFDEDIEEKELRLRPRQNVIYEAGMAMIFNPKRTVLVELGKSRLPSDLDGMHTVRLNDSIVRREELIEKLRITHCIVDTTGEEWRTAGKFKEAVTFTKVRCAFRSEL